MSSVQQQPGRQGGAQQNRQTIAVFNATGRHAGAVARALKARNRFDVRALVASELDPKAQEMKQDGFEVVEGTPFLVVAVWRTYTMRSS